MVSADHNNPDLEPVSESHDPANPSDIELPPWRSDFARALYQMRNDPTAKYFQLATVRPDGTPANRTLVFRGFDDPGSRLTMVSDLRSRKIEELRSRPEAEICWYFTETRDQFRMAGPIAILGPDRNDDQSRLRRRIWSEMSHNAREMFWWPTPADPRANKDAFQQAPEDRGEPTATFAVLVLTPLRVEHLRLRGEPQNRWIHQRDAVDRPWVTREVNP